MLEKVADSANPFEDPQNLEAYAERARAMVPAYQDIHRMAAVLIAERAPRDGRILVLGGGGGLETKALADAQPGWTFDLVDPAAAMLDLAASNLADRSTRVRMHHGYIDSAPTGPFDAATSLLTLHFLAEDERRATAAEVRRRLVTGAPFVVMHLSVPQCDESERKLWLQRHVAYLVAAGVDPADAEKARQTITTQVPFLTPEQDRSVLVDAGFTAVTEFFSAFTFRGWVGYA